MRTPSARWALDPRGAAATSTAVALTKEPRGKRRLAAPSVPSRLGQGHKRPVVQAAHEDHLVDVRVLSVLSRERQGTDKELFVGRLPVVHEEGPAVDLLRWGSTTHPSIERGSAKPPANKCSRPTAPEDRQRWNPRPHCRVSPGPCRPRISRNTPQVMVRITIQNREARGKRSREDVHRCPP